MNVGSFLDFSAARFPDKTALVFKDTRLTYRQLRKRVLRLSSALGRLGLEKGDRVATVMWNCREMLEIYLAAVTVGALFTPLNFRASPKELAFLLADSEPSVLFVDEKCREAVLAAITDPRLFERLYGTSPSSPDLKLYENLIESSSLMDHAVSVSGNDPCQLLYTSGTTGRPKGVLLSHDNVCWNSVNIGAARQDRESDVVYVVGPLFHSAALNSICTARLSRGTTIILHERFDLQYLMEDIEREKITFISAPPTVFMMLMENCRPGDYDTSSVTSITSGGDALGVTAQQALREYFPNFKGIHNIYGLTEGGPNLTCLPAEQSMAKCGSIGLPLPFLKLKLFDDQDNEVPKGQIGEIVVQGPNVMKGYYHQPEATAEVLRNGWLHTGDCAWEDEEGFLFLSHRKKDIIVSGAENISSREVEEVLAKHPDIFRAACFAAPDAKWGERVVAAIIPRGKREPTLDEIREHCRKDLAGYKLPKEIMVVEEFPETGLGKVKKFELKKMYLAGRK
ncbi:MAG: AMP-binding protein [Deltaproteobacteria bacterium]|nr:AMP-binding protein [Deltaproteobacteria bacterium]